MSKFVIVIVAFILNVVSIIFGILEQIQLLKLPDLEGVKCVGLKNEKCTKIIWNIFFYSKKSYCGHNKCPGFAYLENGELKRTFSFVGIVKIFINQIPAMVTLILLFLEIVD